MRQDYLPFMAHWVQATPPTIQAVVDYIPWCTENPAMICGSLEGMIFHVSVQLIRRDGDKIYAAQFIEFLSLDNMLNDLWQWNFTSRQWVWQSGTNVMNHIGVYAPTGICNTSSVPSGRFGHGMIFKNSTEELWIFGGYLPCKCPLLDHARVFTRTNGQLLIFTVNDLWSYNIPSNCWTWQFEGTAWQYSYGQKGVSSPSNVLRGRAMHGMAFRQSTDEIWVFGGSFDGLC